MEAVVLLSKLCPDDYAEVDLLICSATSFYNNLKQDKNGRYRLWEHCCSGFCHACDKETADIDYLSLQLAFYLASWGCTEAHHSCCKKIKRYIYYENFNEDNGVCSGLK